MFTGYCNCGAAAQGYTVDTGTLSSTETNVLPIQYVSFDTHLKQTKAIFMLSGLRCDTGNNLYHYIKAHRRVLLLQKYSKGNEIE